MARLNVVALLVVVCLSACNPAPRAPGPRYAVDVLDVQDLLSRAGDFPSDDVPDPLEAEALVRLLTARDHPRDWLDPAMIEVHRGQLVVNQTRDVHDRLRAALATLRALPPELRRHALR